MSENDSFNEAPFFRFRISDSRFQSKDTPRPRRRAGLGHFALAATDGGGKMQGRTADLAVKKQRYDAVV
jgi:hypothetical protein